MLRNRPTPLAVEVYWDSGEALFIVLGELDGVAAADLAERMVEVAKVLQALNGQSARLIVDLAGVGYLNQAAARALVTAREQLLPDGSFLVRSPSRAARRLLGPAGLLEGSTAVSPPRSGEPAVQKRIRRRTSPPGRTPKAAI